MFGWRCGSASRASRCARANEVKDLAEQDQPPQVVICALPVEIIERVSNMRSQPSDDDQEDVPADESEPEDAPVVDREIENFRGALKAATLALRIPIQIVWPTTYDNDAVVKRKLAEFADFRVDRKTRPNRKALRPLRLALVEAMVASPIRPARRFRHPARPDHSHGWTPWPRLMMTIPHSRAAAKNLLLSGSPSWARVR